jgi:hypothetical protein
MGIGLSECPSNSLSDSNNYFKNTTRNIVHRHEPPVTSRQVKILQHDVEREFLVVDKPGSIVRLFVLTFSNDNHSSQIIVQPVHASGRYYQNSLIQILVNDFGYKKCYRKPGFSPKYRCALTASSR